jgi:hypothetical protein
VLGLLEGEEADPHPEAQLVETAGGTTMVKLTTTYTAAFGEYLKVQSQLTHHGLCTSHWTGFQVFFNTHHHTPEATHPPSSHCCHYQHCQLS